MKKYVKGKYLDMTTEEINEKLDERLKNVLTVDERILKLEEVIDRIKNLFKIQGE